MQTSTTAYGPREDDDYAAMLRHLHAAATTQHPLFTTDAAGLCDAFLDALPADRRQHYVCRTCRHFVERFGGLVTIDEAGTATSPLWDGWALPPFFSDAVRACSRIVARARVTGVFLTSDATLGNPQNASPKCPGGIWRHMHTTAHTMKRNALLSADQVAAEKREDYGTLCRGLAEFPIEMVRQAHTLLTTGGLYRSEKCIGTAKWLLDLHEGREATKHARAREHLTWRAVALAPPGFCHVRSTMIGTLLEDLAVGKAFEEIKRSFDGKMHPLQYQRPQAAPTDGQLAAAEKVVEKLASSGALIRRFATLEDIADDAVWMPKAPVIERPGGGVFGHLKSGRGDSPIDVPAQVITWEKFWRTVLPEAERVECRVPSHGNFFAFVTASNLDAPPILQWDSEGSRNPVSWYIYHGGSPATSWGLQAGAFVPVVALTTQPSSWGGGSEHQGQGVYIVIEGARDSRKSGLALFPEILKSEYHGIRAAMEAYSRSREIETVDTPTCGLALQKSGGPWDGVLRVTSKGARVIYKLDRWD
jgi:hypothetical protein